MDRGQPQLEPADTARVALEPEPAAAPVGPGTAPESAVPTGARGPQDASQYQGVLSHGGVEQRERYVLQLQRTAGNAAVSRWLAMVGRRRAEHLAGGSDEPPDDSPRER